MEKESRIIDISPENVTKMLIEALRSLSNDKNITEPWLQQLTLVSRMRNQNHPPVSGDVTTWAIRRVLEESITALESFSPEDAKLLRLRFFEGHTVPATAELLSLSESSIFYRQRRATHQLAKVLINRESDHIDSLRTEHPESLPEPRRQSLPPANYSQLFGIQDKEALLHDLLMNPRTSHIINIIGIGGMGKTTLAHATAHWAQEEGLFDQVIWLTAKKEEYNTWQGRPQPITDPNQIQATENSHHRVYITMLDMIAAHLGMAELHDQNSESTTQDSSEDFDFSGAIVSSETRYKQEVIQAYLEKNPALIVIDNLETVEEASHLVEQCRVFANPSQLLITSRHSVQQMGVYELRMDELNQQDSLALFKAEAAQRGVVEIVQLPDSALYDIYDVVGGNPLALKLVAGQITILPLSEIIDRLKKAHKSADAEYELYRYIYWQTWQLLSAEENDAMLAMAVLSADGVTLDDLALLVDMPSEDVGKTLIRLANLSLLNVSGLLEKRYSIHRLTYTFLMTDILKLW